MVRTDLAPFEIGLIVTCILIFAGTVLDGTLEFIRWRFADKWQGDCRDTWLVAVIFWFCLALIAAAYVLGEVLYKLLVHQGG